MRRFAELYETLDATTRTNAKVGAIAAYLEETAPEDAAWAVFFLTGRRFKRLISGRTLRAWAERRAGLPAWLAADAYAAVGDSAETATLLLDDGGRRELAPPLPLHRWVEERVLPLRGRSDEEQYTALCAWWEALPQNEIFVLNKLLTGSFRVGVSNLLVVRALAGVSGLAPAVVSHRLMGAWRPGAAWYRQLVAPEQAIEDRSRPYPFHLASHLDQAPQSLGDPAEWLVEWKWDGIRAQLIRRGGEIFVWSRGEELVTDRFPELVRLGGRLRDGTVLDGEILAWGEDGVLPFALLQRRIGRDRLSPRILQEAPVCFLAYDLLEQDGTDLRSLPLAERRRRLQDIATALGGSLAISTELEVPRWEALAPLRAGARERRVEGLMLKRREAPYGVGRQRGAWWKWKVDPLTVDAVLVYAQAGSGRRSNLFTDYTFAVWNGDGLVPIAKAYSGLSDQEIQSLDRWVRRHTLERFGPVRAVEPVHVFELGFEGIQASTRHKSGVALRFPRILRWRTDKPAADADRLEHLKAMLPEMREG